VDALCLWEPFVSRIQRELGAQVQLVPIPKLYTETFNLMATHAVIKSRPKQLERVVLALKDSTNYIQANPDEAKALAVRHLNIPFSLINGIFDDYRYRLSLSRSLVRTMEGQARWALREGHVSRTLPQPDFARLVYPDILRSIDPGAVSLH
jgi:NitT/TauT family transport system substrate-binding protein